MIYIWGVGCQIYDSLDMCHLYASVALSPILGRARSVLRKSCMEIIMIRLLGCSIIYKALDKYMVISVQNLFLKALKFSYV